jgi:tetratricopeptide (TPR) repeat protein
VKSRASILLIIGLLFAGTSLAAGEPQCGGGRTVDDYLVDIAKSQRKQRNKNPLPDSVCVFGWCRHKTSSGSPPSAEKKQPSTAEQAPSTQTNPPSGESSSKQSGEQVVVPAQAESEGCDPMRAAKDVEVGDFYYAEKSDRPALNRYKLALESWPNEPNILYRVAKTYERMKDAEHALEYYKHVVAADPDTPLAKEANAALTRLKR